MTTKKVLLALAATSFLALGSVVPADPDSMESGDAAPDPGTDEGDSSNMDSGAEGGTEGGDQPQ